MDGDQTRLEYNNILLICLIFLILTLVRTYEYVQLPAGCSGTAVLSISPSFHAVPVIYDRHFLILFSFIVI